MTICELILKPITRMVEEEKKSLDDIANAVCPKVQHGREKIIRVIKDFIGEEYLIQHAESLGYDVKMSELAKKRRSHKKIDAREDGDSSDSKSVRGSCDNVTACCGGGQESLNPSFNGNVLDAVRALVEIFGLNMVREAIESLVSETPKDIIE